MSTLKQVARSILDLSIFALLCFAEFAINQWFAPSRRGFFCGDESLAYPFRPSTVPTRTMLVVVLAVPSLVVLAVELCQRLDSAGRKSGARVLRRLRACYEQLGCYLFGLALTLVATEVGKYSTGRLRPHFFAVCQPQLADGSSCADARNQRVYIEDYSCRAGNVTQDLLLQVGQSFPSGHASIFFYAMLYVALYLQATLTTRASRLLKHLLQFVFVTLAWFVALSRVADHWHHWSDVLAGSLLGSFFAVVVAVFVADLFAERQRRPGASGSASKASTKASTPSLPAYTFGSVPYLSNQYGQPYHNYGYVS